MPLTQVIDFFDGFFEIDGVASLAVVELTAGDGVGVGDTTGAGFS